MRISRISLGITLLGPRQENQSECILNLGKQRVQYSYRVLKAERLFFHEFVFRKGRIYLLSSNRRERRISLKLCLVMIFKN